MRTRCEICMGYPLVEYAKQTTIGVLCDKCFEDCEPLFQLFVLKKLQNKITLIEETLMMKLTKQEEETLKKWLTKVESEYHFVLERMKEQNRR